MFTYLLTDVHLDFHTAPELWSQAPAFHLLVLSSRETHALMPHADIIGSSLKFALKKNRTSMKTYMYDSAITKTIEITVQSLATFTLILEQTSDCVDPAETRVPFQCTRKGNEKPKTKQNKTKMVTGITPNWQSRQYNSVIFVFSTYKSKKTFFVFEYISPSQLSPHHRETPSLYSKQTLAQTKLPLRTFTNLT